MNTHTFDELDPKPKIRLHIEDLSHPAVPSFDTLIDVSLLIPLHRLGRNTVARHGRALLFNQIFDCSIKFSRY